jgi:predicted short-subunit dehydrogenase-like oxidoreductase (DUF2520 family)
VAAEVIAGRPNGFQFLREVRLAHRIGKLGPAAPDRATLGETRTDFAAVRADQEYRQFADREGGRVKPWRSDAKDGPAGRSDAGRNAPEARGRAGDSLAAWIRVRPGGAPRDRGLGDAATGADRKRTEGDPGPPLVGIVGAGPVGTALGVAISRASWPVAAVASRDSERRAAFCRLVPGARPFIDAIALLDEVELIVLAVPDDAIPEVIEPLRLYGGQAMIHTSGLLGADALEPALAAGSHVGAFHPLVSFTADVERSVEALAGATVALEADEFLMTLLADLAEAIGGRPVRLPRGSKPLYHAAAVMASGGLVALLDAVVRLGAGAGIDEAGSLALYGRLLEQTLANARAVGVAAALTGPMVRGDAGTVAAHVAALEARAPDLLDLYASLARREIAIAEDRGALSTERRDRVLSALAKGR